jgi:DNA-binding transcriptional LysR family regulator
MKLTQLRNIVTIAERGSLRAAARHLSMAQPVLTRNVRELEHELGIPLFERRARGMILTPMGQVFVRRASAILNEVRLVREEIEQLHGGVQGSVVCGLSISAHIALLPHAFRPFHKRYPDVKLHIIEGQYPSLEREIQSGKMDFYVGPLWRHALPSDLICEKLLDNKRAIFGRKGHPLAKARSLRELVSAEWATTSITQRAEDELQEIFAHYRLPEPRLAVRSQSALTTMMALLNTDFLAMLPVQWTDFPIIGQALISIPVRESLPAPPLVVIRRSELPLTPAAEFFVDLLRRRASISK